MSASKLSCLSWVSPVDESPPSFDQRAALG
jgi:hypothetical protein